MAAELKKLYRDTEHKMIAGVCAGLSEYLNVDVALIRLVTVLFAFTGGGILAYILGVIIIPEKPAA